MRIQLFTLGIATTVLSLGSQFALLYGAELDAKWATLSEASTDTFYYDRVHSRTVKMNAVAKLSEIAKSERPRIKATAEKLMDGIGKKQVADAEANKSLANMKKDEKTAQFMMVVGGIQGSAGDAERNLIRMLSPRNFPNFGDDPNNNITVQYADIMLGPNGLAASATKAALAAQAAAEARAEVHKIWQNQVFPAVRNSKLEELKTPIIESTFTSNGRGRQILACFRNISGKILTNVTVTLDMKDVSKSLSQRAYFIRSWPSDVIIHADPFTRIAAPTEIVGNLPPTVMSGSFETWSDQGHVASANVTPVGYYDMRNAFVDTIVYEGARYAHLDKKSQMVLEFTKVATQGNDRKVSATLIRPREGTSEKVDVTRYEGVWETRPTQKSNLRNVYGLQLTLTELGAAPLPEKNVRIPGMSGRNVRPGQKPPAPKYPSIDFRWTEKGYSVDFNKDGSFAVLPISDALTK